MISFKRFSLLNLLLLTALVAAVVALYGKHAELRRAEQELSHLRQIAGYLRIEDEDQVHVIAAPVPGPSRYRWRIYLPGGHDFGLFAYRGEVTSGSPTPPKGESVRGGGGSRTRTVNLALLTGLGAGQDPFQPREVLVDVELKQAIDGEYCLAISQNGRRDSLIRLGNSLPSWAEHGNAFLQETVAARDAQESVPVTGSLRLLQVERVLAPGQASTGDSVLLWLGPWTSHAAAAVESVRAAPPFVKPTRIGARRPAPGS